MGPATGDTDSEQGDAAQKRVIRVLRTNTLVATFGYGLYLSGSALFFVRVAGISPAEVGAGFSAAGLAGVLVSIHVGRMTDHVGAREVNLGFALLQAALLIAAVFVRSFWAFLPVIIGIGIAESGSTVSRGSLIGNLLPKEIRVRNGAITRVLTNIGLSLGVACAGVAIEMNSAAAYGALLLSMAVAILTTAASTMRLPHIAPLRDQGARTRSAYDLPYMAASLVSSMTLIGNTILTVGLPIWIVDETSAPRQLAAWLILGNTLLVVLFNVRVSKGGQTAVGATRMQRGAFAALACASATVAFTHRLGVVPATVVLLVAVIFLTIGEMWGENATWYFRFALADSQRHGAYSGMFTMSNSVPTVIGPALVTFLTSRFVPSGWFLLTLAFAAFLCMSYLVLPWAERAQAETHEQAAAEPV